MTYFLVLVSEDSKVTHWTLVKTSLTCCDKMVLNFGKQLQNIDMEMLRGTKFGSGARALAVKPDDDTVYLVGTEEGLIHLCTTEYASKYLATFQAHNTPVRMINLSKSNQILYPLLSIRFTRWNGIHSCPMCS